MSIQNWKVLYCDCEKYSHLCEVYERLDNKPADLTVEKLLETIGWRANLTGTQHKCKSCYEADKSSEKKGN